MPKPSTRVRASGIKKEIAEGGEALHAFAGNLVVEGVHRKESSGLPGGGKAKIAFIKLQCCCDLRRQRKRGTVIALWTVGREWGGACVLLLGCLAICSAALAQDVPNSPPAQASPTTSSPAEQAPQSSPQNQQPQNQDPKTPKPADQKPDDQKRDEKKDDSANPAQAAVDKTKDLTVQAAEATKQLGQAALVKARDWENGWFVGIYVPRGRVLVPMTVEQRREIYLQQTLTTPSAYLKRMFAAGIDQARGVPYQWDDGWGGYAERFASREGQFIASNSLAALGNAALKYEVRYDECRCRDFWGRTRHAILRNFLTYDQSEQHLRPQWALYGGSFGGGVISTAWKPHPRNAFAEGGRAMAEQAGFGAALNLFIEFSPDINLGIGARKK
jgi:hypothetical protein